MLFLLTFFSILGITFSENPSTKKIKKTISIEGMSDAVDAVDAVDDDYICTKHVKHPQVIDKMCNDLSEKSCKIISCCGWLNKEKCVGGDKFGPTYHPDKQTSWQWSE